MLDVTELQIDRAQLKELLAELSNRNVSIMGIEGARPSMMAPGMPPALKGGRPSGDIEVKQTEPVSGEVQTEPPRVEITEQPRPTLQSLVIKESVRSGQSVIFAEGDVTSWALCHQVQKSSQAGQSTSTEACGAAPWRAPLETHPHGSSAASWKPNWWQSTASTRWPKTSRQISLAILPSYGSKVMRSWQIK